MSDWLMDPADIRQFLEADIAYTEFNTRRALRPRDGRLERVAFGEATAFRDLTTEDSYYNRVVGLDEASLSFLPKLVDYYHDEARPCHVTLVQPKISPLVLEELGSLNFALEGLDCIFATRIGREETPSPSIPIRRAKRDDLEAVFDLWQVSGPKPIDPEVRERRSGAQLAQEYPIYLALDGDRPMAMASMFVHGPIAWLGNANTFVEDRNKGCQLALLVHRVREAGRRGCSWAIADSQFGTVSHGNALRAGMRLQFVTLGLSLPHPERRDDGR